MAILDGPDVQTLNTTFGPVRVRDTGGPGRPLLLIHSLLVDPDLYATLVPLLTSRGYRCLLPELPLGGHRLPLLASADLAPDALARLLVEVLDRLGVERVPVVGVDTGGALTQLLMANHRDRVGAVVLTACDAYDAFPPRSFGPALRLLRRRAPLWWLSQLTRLRLGRRLLVVRPVTHRGVPDATLRRWTSPLRDPAIRADLAKVVSDMNARYTEAAAEQNRDFPRPVLIAWGEDARVFPRRLAERLHADLPDSRLVTLPDCAAFAALDQPELLAQLIHAHLGAGTPARDHV